MGTTIESLPNEVLEIVFSILAGPSKLPMPAWELLQAPYCEPDWVSKHGDVVSLSYASKRFCKVGSARRQIALSLQQSNSTGPGFWARPQQGIQAARMSAVRLLYVHLQPDDTGYVAAHLLGERFHLLPSLEHLHMRFDRPLFMGISKRPCCGADREFFTAVIANPYLGEYELSSFRIKTSDGLYGSSCPHIQLWQAVADLKVRDLALERCPTDNGGYRCPAVRRLAVGFDDYTSVGKIWRTFGNLEELWMLHEYNFDFKGVEFWKDLPESVRSLGVPGRRTSDVQAVMKALEAGKLCGLRRFVSGLRPCSGSHSQASSQEEEEARMQVMQDIDTVLRARGGKAEMLEQDGQEASWDMESLDEDREADSESDGY